MLQRIQSYNTYKLSKLHSQLFLRSSCATWLPSELKSLSQQLGVSVLLCHPPHCIPSGASCFSSSCISRAYRANTSPWWDSITPLMSPPSSAESEAAAKAGASFIPALSQICLQGGSKGGTGPSLPSGAHHLGMGAVSVAWCWAEQGSFYIHAAQLWLSLWPQHAQAELLDAQPALSTGSASTIPPACLCLCLYSLILKLSMPWHILSVSSWFSHEKNELSWYELL